MTNIPIVLLFGILSSIQIHLAKALERQGIEVFEQLKARLQKSNQPVAGSLKKPLIYTIGLVLNHTVFIWALLAQPYGPPALFSSMFGVGLVFLMGYAVFVLKEQISRAELVGAVSVLVGTLLIGVENIALSDMDRFTMRLTPLLLALGLWLCLSLALVIVASRSVNLTAIALAFGTLAGGLGSLDPFFKGVGQTYGGQPGILPSNVIGGIFFFVSFGLGFLAFVVTQVGFARKVRASILVPAYNAAFIGLPVLWQILLLPSYRLAWLTVSGLLLIIGGAVAIGARKRDTATG